MTALRFQTGGRHQISPASLRGSYWRTLRWRLLSHVNCYWLVLFALRPSGIASDVLLPLRHVILRCINQSSEDDSKCSLHPVTKQQQQTNNKTNRNNNNNKWVCKLKSYFGLYSEITGMISVTNSLKVSLFTPPPLIFFFKADYYCYNRKIHTKLFLN